LGAVDIPTILLLYGLMIVSAQLRLGGFYTWTAIRITSLFSRPRIFLLVMMLTGAVLSAILANDIVCLAFTPVLAVSLLRTGLNPVPFLIGLAVSSNIGSAATIIGNPQNMLIGQVGKLDFGHFLCWCGPPALFSLAGSYAFIVYKYGNRLFRETGSDINSESEDDWPAFDRWQSIKGLAATGGLIILFFTHIPREISALGIAGILLCSRKMKSQQIMERVDWHLITLFCALFIVIHGITAAGVPDSIMDAMPRNGLVLQNPLLLTGISAALSNMVSNVPAAMLLVRFLDPGNPVEWYTLAVSSTFAGNMITIGSIANLIVMEQARHHGIDISFREHAATGIPVTLFSLGILVLWNFICI